MDKTRLQVTIDLALDPEQGETISGELRDSDRNSRPFFGWLDLINQLEAWRSSVLDPPAKE